LLLLLLLLLQHHRLWIALPTERTLPAVYIDIYGDPLTTAAAAAAAVLHTGCGLLPQQNVCCRQCTRTSTGAPSQSAVPQNPALSLAAAAAAAAVFRRLWLAPPTARVLPAVHWNPALTPAAAAASAAAAAAAAAALSHTGCGLLPQQIVCCRQCTRAFMGGPSQSAGHWIPALKRAAAAAAAAVFDRLWLAPPKERALPAVHWNPALTPAAAAAIFATQAVDCSPNRARTAGSVRGHLRGPPYNRQQGRHSC
jgi:hypothetical protein